MLVYLSEHFMLDFVFLEHTYNHPNPDASPTCTDHVPFGLLHKFRNGFDLPKNFQVIIREFG